MLDPLDYPGAWVDGPVVVGCAPLRPVPRTRLVAVGANGAPAVLHDKLHAAGVACDVEIVPATLTGVAIGHSAHVSALGYVPAAPFAAPGVVTAVRVLGLDDAQLAAVDATEPNYVRTPTAAGQLYVSRWGVLALDGRPLPLMPQPRLYRLLGERLGAPFDPADPQATAARLGRPQVRAAVRGRWVAAGMVLPDGLRPTG